MKACPYCGEQIQDAAIRCRFCNSDLTTVGARSPEPVQAGAAPQFTHSGARYLLGHVPDAYGVWDRYAPGPPVARFPRTHEGWQQAWAFFATREPQPVGAPSAGPVYVQAQRTNGLAIASMVLGILWLYGVGSILALVFGYVGKGQIDQSAGTQGGRGMAIAGIVLGWVGVALVIIVIIMTLVIVDRYDPYSF